MNAETRCHARVPLPEPEEMTAHQRAVHDEVVAGRRGKMVGPLRAVIHNPELARDWSKLGARLRYDTSLGSRYSELAILVSARYWSSQVEWTVHANEALDAGLPMEVVEAIAAGTAPRFADATDHFIYEFARELLSTGRASAAPYAAVRGHWGDIGVVELTALIGYYSMVAMTLNAHEVPMPADRGAAPPLPGTGRFDVPESIWAGEKVA